MASIPEAWLVVPAQLAADEDAPRPRRTHSSPAPSAATKRPSPPSTLRTPAILRFLTDLLGDHAAAADATQETFVRAFRRLDTLRGTDRIAPWLFGIARNVSLEHKKARRRRGRVLVLGEPRCDGSPSAKAPTRARPRPSCSDARPPAYSRAPSPASRTTGARCSCSASITGSRTRRSRP